MQSWVRSIFVILSLLCSVTCLAQTKQVYQSVNTQGTTTYSAEPSSGAQAVKLTPVTIMPVTTTAPAASVSPQPDIHVYQQLSLLSPVNDQTITDNNGQVTVSTTMSPALASDDNLQLLLDGKVLAQSQKQYDFTLNNLDRGTHVLQAQIANSAGQIIKVSNIVTFYLHRAIAAQPVTKP